MERLASPPLYGKSFRDPFFTRPRIDRVKRGTVSLVSSRVIRRTRQFVTHFRVPS